MDNKIHIPVFVHNKVALAPPDARIVCGNSDYVVDFHFDEDWDGIEEKIALFTFKRNNCPDSAKVEFTGTSVEVPVLHGIKQVQVGVYAGNLQTTTGAKIPCDLSILDTAPEDGEVSPTEAARLDARVDEVVANAAALRQKVEGLTAEDVDAMPADDATVLQTLINTDMLPAVHDADGAILTDQNGNVILRY